MDALFLLIPLSVLALGVAAWLFVRMSRSGQFDQGEGPAWRVLMDDDRGPPEQGIDVDEARASAPEADLPTGKSPHG